MDNEEAVKEGACTDIREDEGEVIIGDNGERDAKCDVLGEVVCVDSIDVGVANADTDVSDKQGVVSVFENTVLLEEEETMSREG